MGLSRAVAKTSVGVFHRADYGTEPRWLILVTAFAAPTGIAVILLYVGSMSQGFDPFQSLLGVVVSLVFLTTLVVAPWLVWLASRTRLARGS